MKQTLALAKVLVASDDADRAARLQQQLESQFEQVRAATRGERAAADFDECEPDVLVLAFDAVDTAHAYLSGLQRDSRMMNRRRHRTVLVCGDDDAGAALSLCRKGVFDDYVLQGTQAPDGQRLLMSTWNAAREVRVKAHGPNAQELLAHVQQLVGIDALIGQQIAEGARQAAAAAEALRQAQGGVTAALDEFARQLAQGPAGAAPGSEPAGAGAQLQRLRHDRLAPCFKTVADALKPLAAWPGQLHERLAPHLDVARAFARRIREMRWVVMVVEDDEFARKLIGKALQDRDYDLVFAEDGAAAVGVLRRIRPDLILMDVNLPDTDGVALTGRIKAAPELSDIPVLMLTGEARRETLESSMGAGAAGFIVKPFTRESLLGKLDRFLPVAAP
jgi:CheY-like chemotaxis protein